MYGPEDTANRLVEAFWQAFQQLAPFAIAILALMWLVGYLSLRFLRDLPDFEHKREMMWGAKWHWAIYAGILTLFSLTMYFGFTLSPYPSTSLLVALALMWVLFALDFVLLPHQNSGQLAIADLWTARLKHQTLDFDSWIARERRNRVKQRRMRIVVAAFWVLLWTGTCGYLAVTSSSLSFDRQLSAMRQQAALAQDIKARLADPLVEEVVVGGPPIVDERKIIIGVKKESSEQQIEEVRDQAGQVMEELDPEQAWEILVAREREDDHRPSRSPPHPRN